MCLDYSMVRTVIYDCAGDGLSIKRELQILKWHQVRQSNSGTRGANRGKEGTDLHCYLFGTLPSIGTSMKP